MATYVDIFDMLDEGQLNSFHAAALFLASNPDFGLEINLDYAATRITKSAQAAEEVMGLMIHAFPEMEQYGGFTFALFMTAVQAIMHYVENQELDTPATAMLMYLSVAGFVKEKIKQTVADDRTVALIRAMLEEDEKRSVFKISDEEIGKLFGRNE